VPLHDAARGFERAADAYERGRPEYPPAAVALLARALALGPGARLLDVGAGTGKLSRLLAATGARVLAVDPAAAMIRRAAGPGVLAARAVAEALPFPAGAFHAAAAGTAFHWFDGPCALAELHRVLAPGGVLGLAWNRRDDAVDWVARLSAIVNRREAGAPRYRSGAWRAAFERAPERFAPVEEAHLPHVHVLPPEGVVARIASVSFIAAMPAADRAAVLGEVRALLASHPDTAGKSKVELAYLTDVHVYARR
jgi:SAM-dependent methyltransferase